VSYRSRTRLWQVLQIWYGIYKRFQTETIHGVRRNAPCFGLSLYVKKFHTILADYGLALAVSLLTNEIRKSIVPACLLSGGDVYYYVNSFPANLIAADGFAWNLTNLP
jgi:hypothetical protein